MELVDEIRHEQVNARVSALQMMRLFQNTLLLPTGRSPQPDDLALVKNDVRASLLLSPLSGDANLQHDIDRIHAEGRAAVQDVMMRIEREQMASAIRWLDSRTDLGYRAAPAGDGAHDVHGKYS